jgi:hypothetical protein
MDSNIESNHDDDNSSIGHMHKQEMRTSNLLLKEEQEQKYSMSKPVDLDQNVIDLTQGDGETIKTEMLKSEVTYDATNSRTDTHALTQLCHTVVESNRKIDELRDKLTEKDRLMTEKDRCMAEKDRLILTLQETDRFEI